MISQVVDTQPAEAYGATDFPLVDTVYDCLRKGLDANPDKVAFISAHQPTDHLAHTVSSTGPTGVDCLQWTYRQINEASLKLATYLVQKCPAGKRRVATLVHHSIEQVIVYWAIAHMRGVFTPLDPTLLAPGRESSRDWYFDTLKPDVVVCWTYNHGLETLLSANAPDTVRISLGHGQSDTLPSNWHSFSSLLCGITVASPTGTMDHDTPADAHATVQILFTSGTTGFPKPVAHSAAQLTPWICLTSQKIPPPVVLLITTANFRPIYMNFLLAVHQSGATLVVSGTQFTASATVAATIKYKANFMLFIPAQLHLMAAEVTKAGTTLSSVLFISLSGDVVTQDSIHLAKSTFPNSTVFTSLASTETWGVAIWPKPQPTYPTLPNGIVSVGLPTPGSVLRVCRPGTFEVLPRGDTGELWVAGPGVPDSYLHGEESQSFRRALDLRGTERRWFNTGDTALLDEKDQLFVSGRCKDIIIRLGVNLSPIAIESALEGLGYTNVQVVGVPHKLLGNAPVAVFKTLDGGENAKKLVIDEAARVLGEDSRLEKVWTLEELGLEDWEYNSTGKVSKTELRRRLLETVLHQSL